MCPKNTRKANQTHLKIVFTGLDTHSTWLDAPRHFAKLLNFCFFLFLFPSYSFWDVWRSEHILVLFYTDKKSKTYFQLWRFEIFLLQSNPSNLTGESDSSGYFPIFTFFPKINVFFYWKMKNPLDSLRCSFQYGQFSWASSFHDGR